ncbi:inositol transport system ATP-binding protein [Paenibacillus sp. UNCCL117]|uniref:sugar ABC transporter ATP-binding protein n=1 Tax=unclassified Paenibacillus TaxID=185978 RepID=UPI0008804DB3|nr:MULTISPECIES: sugar ABC transporter ATP-binding protein [unclassified Paenibacillus]SDE10531.1 monosaccharide ABC transporter ATP-binding protein, CUT2 family [Paenibacillus sp. cl123]SFW59788.1 inositol transport system ATP-binding protein [Paenibacillus sp. UNCCL117]
MTDTVLEMTGISKTFHGVKALSEVSLRVRRGEVHALMGENGAGKSTLMKILTGLVKPDEGEIRFQGERVRIDTPQQALALGIAMIHQELSPIPDMTIAENIFLGREPMRAGLFLDRRRLHRQTRELLEQFDLRAEPGELVGSLSVAQKQMLEIIKAVSYEAKLIIMDEPTSALSDNEVKTLFRTIERLKSRGVPIIYISHRMEEIFAMTDRVTVLRDGQYVGSEPTADLDAGRLISMMVGRPLDAIFPKEAVAPGAVVFEADRLTRSSVFEDVSFQVRAGEIVGIAGLMGAGRSEVMRAIFGIDRLDSGEVKLAGRPVKIRHPADAIRSGIAMVTEDRKEQGLVLCRSIRENMTLARMPFSGGSPFISGSGEAGSVDEMTGKIRIKMRDMEQTVQNLSGGNQQKVVIAKWLMTKPKLLILDEPTRGIDVGAKAEIYKLMSSLAKEGLAIIMVSSELPEVLGMSDRILVMWQGRIKGEFQRDEATQEQILTCAIGGGRIA